ncbi:LytR family transcriptional regulator [Halalkalibacillus sediminis]|uniref:Regulatory protein MsrR n=1 Tax=Halalkalibacillus sediminis TaxID=2018042 RepID=A0A2I0QW56_9BACI|nr:LCP family protein [Halalkalibacillus sediminis]PKR78340.1 LytR family transcriptional regulator [Halalkalibacillus sediminis]
MENNRTKRRKRQRRRKRKLFISSILVVFFSIIIFGIYEYWDGKNQAEEDIEKYQDTEQSEDFENNFQGNEPTDEKTNVLILGSDQDQHGISRTDTIMIGQYNTNENSAKLVSIMRDTYVDIPGEGYNKINAAYAIGGPELLRKTIEENFGIEINYYSIVNFRGFEQIVDTIAPDGVEIDIEKRMYYETKDVTIDLYPGEQKLDGEQLLDYARFRADKDNDFGRVARQQHVMSLLKEEMTSFTGVINLPRAVGTLQPYIDTNMETSKIISLAGDYFMDTPDQIETLRIPIEPYGESYWNENHSHAGAVLEIDEQLNREALQEFLDAE